MTIAAISTCIFFSSEPCDRASPSSVCVASSSGTSRQGAFTLTGTVTNSASSPLYAVQVFITKPSGNTSFNVTNSAGIYKFEYLEPGNYNLTFQQPGYLIERRTVAIVSSDTVLNVVMNASGILHGTISSSSGLLAGARVQLYNSLSTMVASAVSDGSGYYNFSSDLRTGSYSIAVMREFYIQKSVGPLQIVEGQTAECNVVLVPSCMLRGVVKNEVGAPLANAQVSFEGGLAGISTNASGSYEFNENIPEGTFTIIAEKSGFVTQRKDVTLTIGNWVTLDFSLFIGTMIEGNVTDILGAPVADAEVTISKGESRYSTTTDGMGRYTMNTELYGICTVEASASGYIVATQEVNLVQATTNICDLTMMHAARVEGVVRDEFGGYIAEAIVWAIHGIDEESALTDDLGRFWFSQNFTEDTYTFHAYKAGYREESQEATLTFANSTILEFTLLPFLSVYTPINDTVSLTQFVNVTGETQPGASVKVCVNGEEKCELTAAPDGAFWCVCNLTHKGANEVKVDSSAFLDSGQYSESTTLSITKNINTPKVSIYTLPGQVFYASPAFISGNVSDADEGDVVEVYARLGNGAWTPLGSNSYWSYDLQFTFSDNGNRTIEVMAVDLGGNVGTASVYLTLEIPASATSLNVVSPMIKFGLPGKVVTFECWVSNYGVGSDTVTVDLNAQHGWQFDVEISDKGTKVNNSQLSFALGSKEFGNFTLKVVIPKEPPVLEESIVVKATSTVSPGLMRVSSMYVKTEKPITPSGTNWALVVGIAIGIIAVVVISAGMIMMNRELPGKEGDEEREYGDSTKEKKRLFGLGMKEKASPTAGPQFPQPAMKSYDTGIEKTMSYDTGAFVQSVQMGNSEFTPYYADAQAPMQPLPQMQQPMPTSQPMQQMPAAAPMQPPMELQTMMPVSQVPSEPQMPQPEQVPQQKEKKEKRKIPMRKYEPKAAPPKIVEPPR